MSGSVMRIYETPFLPDGRRIQDISLRTHGDTGRPGAQTRRYCSYRKAFAEFSLRRLLSVEVAQMVQPKSLVTTASSFPPNMHMD